MAVCRQERTGLSIDDKDNEPSSGTSLSLPDSGHIGKKMSWTIVLLLVLVLGSLIAFFVKMPETPLEQAISLIKANKPAAALPILEEIAQKQPESSLYLPWLAQCYLNTDRLAEARTALDTAIKLKLPCDTLAPIVLNFSRYYKQRHDFAESERLLSSVQSLCPAADFQQERKDLYTSWAEEESKSGAVAEALAHMETLVSLESSPLPEALSHMMAELYRQQAAIEETQNGNDEKAIKLLEKSLAVADEPASRMAIGNLYSKNNTLDKAMEQYRQVAKADPNNLEARHKLIEIAMKINDLQGAQEAASELADREKCVENFQLLADLDLRLQNYAGAVRALEDAVGLASKDIELLEALHDALKAWSDDLLKHGKQDESISVKGRAERVSEEIKAIMKELNPDSELKEQIPEAALKGPSISLTASKIWLSKGSLTPEGEIRLKNSGSEPLADLSLSVVFYDNTVKKRAGSVLVSAANSGHPMLPGQTRYLYFSSPNIVRGDHQLSVIIFWKGKLIRELPVVKER